MMLSVWNSYLCDPDIAILEGDKLQIKTRVYALHQARIEVLEVFLDEAPFSLDSPVRLFGIWLIAW